MKCTILYDNLAGGDLKSGWGFSCLIEAHGKMVLFDTGDNGEALLSNMKKLMIDPQDIDCLFISHGHWDHCGGIRSFLRARGSLPVFVPASALPMLKDFESMADLQGISGPGELFAGVCTTGEMNGIEQSLVVKGEKGNVVVCGCSHPGLEKIIEKAREFGAVYGVIGGFHGFDKLDALKGIRVIAPCHCTQYKLEIAKSFPETCVGCRTGAVFEM
jgi:7,8-dihydropterin-6-yl-methyl-4-(beta-D-ribofuranosyl)aminobenzene 5'-phosphate synthase